MTLGFALWTDQGTQKKFKLLQNKLDYYCSSQLNPSVTETKTSSNESDHF